MTAAIQRRALLQASLGSLVLPWAVTTAGAAPMRRPTNLNGWVKIDRAGKVTLVTHRFEMGQGSFTSVPQLLAEELEVDVTAVAIEHAPTNPEIYGSQVTGGSSTIRTGWKPLMQAGAKAREMLIQAAALRWQVDRAECSAKLGRVIHNATGRSLSYGDLVEAASKLQPPAEVKLKARASWHTVGTPVKRLDLREKVEGKAVFGIDFKLPGMLVAVVARSPMFEGKVKSFNASEVMKLPGVTHVLKVERDVFGHLREGVAVVATSTWAAMRGKRALRVEWDDSGLERFNTQALLSRQVEALSRKPLVHKEQGSIDSVLATSGVLEATYQTPYQAHACMEPLNCTAHVTKDKVRVWGPIQAPEWVRDHLVRALGRPAADIEVNCLFMGGAFGRKAFADYPHEAVMLSIATGKPVQVVWDRQDDLSQGPFRPAITYRCKGVLDAGKVMAMEVIGAGPNIGHQVPNPNRTQANGSLIEGLPEAYLESIPNFRFGDVPVDSAVPVMWWRSVYASTNCFAYESFVDELARAAGADPLAFRRSHLHKPRLQRLLDEVEAATPWRSRKSMPGQLGWGLSLVEAFGSYVAEVVCVEKVGDQDLKIAGVWVVIDCGWVVNPDTVKAQVEGSVLMGIAAATVHQVTFNDGAADRLTFGDYPLPQLRDVYPVHVHIVQTDDDPGGVGEPALPGIAPALTSAVFDLTGKRHRSLPFQLGT